MSEKFCVIGDPIDHSLSPKIHDMFARSCNLYMTYERVRIQKDDFLQEIQKLRDQKFVGANVTAPLKECAFNYVTELSKEATFAKAVNTIEFKDGIVVGHNTDGLGLLQDITANLKYELQDVNVLILGAGGAVRGILYPLFQKNTRMVSIYNRTFVKAENLAREFSRYGRVRAIEEITSKKGFDLVINAIPGDNSDVLSQVKPGCILDHTLCYDITYSPHGMGTNFTKWAKQQGAFDSVDGIGMLVEQAALSFEMWHGVQPKTKRVTASLRASR